MTTVTGYQGAELGGGGESQAFSISVQVWLVYFAPAWAMDLSASYIADRENEACKRCIYIYIYIYIYVCICIYIDIDGKSVFRFLRSIVLDI